jgi:exopolysaccharide production protein ExoQ
MSTVVMAPADISESPMRGVSRANRKMDVALLIPLIFFACHGVFSFQSAGESSGGFLPGKVAITREHGLFGYAITAASYLVVGCLIWSRIRMVLSFAWHFKALTVLGLLAFFSCLWSQEPTRSFLFGGFYLAGTLFAYSLVIRFKPEELMALMTTTGVALSILGLLLITLFPRYGISAGTDVARSNAWIGIFLDRTSAAKCFVFLLSPVLAAWGKRLSVARIGYVVLLILMIIKAKSVTPILVLLLYVMFLVALRLGRRAGQKVSMAVMGIGIVFVILITPVAIEAIPAILEAFGRDATLSGRTGIWSALMVSVSKSPVLGYGFYAFWLALKGESANVILATHWTFGYAHNGMMEVLLQLGWFGAIVFLTTLFQAIRDAWFCWWNDREGRYDWYLGIILLTVVYNIDEVTILLPNELLSILYIVACCGLSLAVRDLKGTRKREETYS